MSLEPGQFSAQLAPRYAVHGELGRGGMAVVYAGTDLHLGRAVAIKVLHDSVSSAVGVERFLREAAVVARLQHPHIVPLLDSGSVTGQPYFVMPLIEGESLRARLARDRQLPIEDVLTIARDVAGALDYAHEKGIVHRDVKPENILLTAGGAMVADFGVSLGGFEGDRLTDTGLVVGTPAYMSPEQASGERRIDGRSDLYSLACVLYEALSGHAPFSGSTPRELIARHISDAVPPLRSARPDLPPRIGSAIARGLAKSPADRPRNARALVDELSGVVRTPTATVATWRPRASLAVVGAVVLAALLINGTRGEAFEAGGWLVLADPENLTGDARFDVALSSGLAVALEQSRHLNVMARQTVSRTLNWMERPDTSRLTPALAAEVAQRTNAAAILLPMIVKDGDRYTLTLRVRAAASGRDVAVTQASVSAVDDVLPTLGGLASELRGRLGESLRSEVPPLPLEAATTSSLDALRAWNEGQRHFRARQYDVAIAAYREAVALDSNFALAHKSLGVTYYWLNDRPRGDQHFERALALAGRLTERERLRVEADAARWRGRLDDALRTERRLLERYPDDLGTRRSLAYGLFQANRLAEAATEYARLLQADSLDDGVNINYASVLAGAGRSREALPFYARAYRLRPEGFVTTGGLLHEYAFAHADAGFPDSARRLLAVIATGSTQQRAQHARSLGLLFVREGHADSATLRFRQAVTLSQQLGNPTTELRNRLLLARTLGWHGRQADARRELRAALPLLDDRRIDAWWISIAVEVAAETDDGPLVARLRDLAAARADSGNVSDRIAMAMANAAAALVTGDTATAVSAAEEAVALRLDTRTVAQLARAYERAGRVAEAYVRFSECTRQREGGWEGTFASIECDAAVARTSLARGDTARARNAARAFLARWADSTSAFELRREMAALLGALGR